MIKKVNSTESFTHEFVDRCQELFRHFLEFVQKGFLSVLQSVETPVEKV